MATSGATLSANGGASLGECSYLLRNRQKMCSWKLYVPVSVQAEIRPKVKFKYQTSNSQEFFDVRKGISNPARKSYKKRDFKDFTQDEQQHLDDLKKNSLPQKLHVFSVFKGPTEQLKNWLYFFDGNEDIRSYGNELQGGLIQLWSAFIVAEALLASLATQPFITPQELHGWKRTWYGMLWMLSLLADIFALGTTTIFLGYLLASPGKLSWIFLCKIGALFGIPGSLVLLSFNMSLLAIGFTTFILYEWKVGIVCAVFEVIIVAGMTYFAILLNTASIQVVESELK